MEIYIYIYIFKERFDRRREDVEYCTKMEFLSSDMICIRFFAPSVMALTPIQGLVEESALFWCFCCHSEILINFSAIRSH